MAACSFSLPTPYSTNHPLKYVILSNAKNPLLADTRTNPRAEGPLYTSPGQSPGSQRGKEIEG
jgi:hypothetical protein